MTGRKKNHLPRHVAIIMDGNGRWAGSRGLSRVSGHQQGAKAVRSTVTACRERGIKVLTLYSFSSQNWSRPSIEVSALMSLLAEYVKLERRTILDNGIRLTTIGEIDRLPEAPRAALLQLIEDSSRNTDMTLCLALSYGGREELAAAVRALARRAALGDLNPETIDTAMLDRALWSAELGPVDLMIRTSGEYRISNFLLWGLAYAELYFVDRMWPDFDEAALDEALAAYAGRQRRFGNVV
ncbi:MAG: polyprenyl diphosphate synthase [Deltaproteobacteria bacterium]|nr:polyprenyl diphosphate synthase [Deltaproteobacteria bacterium]